MNDKQKIINLFKSNVKNKKIDSFGNHCGKEGHWLESQMGLQINCKNEPDILGYEMKKDSKKITFGDFSASEYLFSKNKTMIENINGWIKNENVVSRDEFIKYFGSKNPLKNNRYSWSGSCVPIYGNYNVYGQILHFNDKLDLCISYSFEKDKREIKHTFPLFLKNNILIAIWKSDKLRNHINNKFNKKGFFICKKNNKNMYEHIWFGKTFNYEYFVENIKDKNIIFDSGMYKGNSRNYSNFRSSGHNFWNKLIIEKY